MSIRRPPRSPLSAPLFPYSTLSRSDGEAQAGVFALELGDLFFLLLEFDFLFRQVLLGLLQHLRRFKDFHELQLLGVPVPEQIANVGWLDRKSTRLNSSH